MAELGLLGLAISLALLAAWIVAARTSIRSALEPERAGLVTFAAIAVVFGAHAFIDWTWSIPGTAAVGLVAAAWVAGRGARATTAARRSVLDAPWPRLAAAAAVAILALAAAWTAWQPLRARDKSDEALAAATAGQPDRARELLGDARDINPLSLEPLLDLSAVEQQAGDDEAAEQALEDAVALQPGNWLPWMRLTDFRLFVKNDPKAAMDSVRVAIYLNPQSWDVSQRYLDVRRRLRQQ
jgi:tetratricopeptide (TPR) repeat protein